MHVIYILYIYTYTFIHSIMYKIIYMYIYTYIHTYYIHTHECKFIYMDSVMLLVFWIKPFYPCKYILMLFIYITIEKDGLHVYI